MSSDCLFCERCDYEKCNCFRSKPLCRCLVRRDLDTVAEIERQSFEFPWSKKELRDTLMREHVIGMVAEGQHTRPLGYIVYKLYPKQIHLLTLAVHPEYRRMGIAGALVSKIIERLTVSVRHRIVCHVRETNLVALMFLREFGFRATQVLPDHYQETSEDAYRMEYKLRTMENKTCPKN